MSWILLSWSAITNCTIFLSHFSQNSRFLWLPFISRMFSFCKVQKTCQSPTSWSYHQWSSETWVACAQLYYPICRFHGGSSSQWVPVPTIMKLVPAFEWRLLLLPLLDQVYSRHLEQCHPCWTVLWSLPIRSWLPHRLFPAKLCVFQPAHYTCWNPCFSPLQTGFPKESISIHSSTPAMWGIPLWFCKSLSDATKQSLFCGWFQTPDTCFLIPLRFTVLLVGAAAFSLLLYLPVYSPLFSEVCSFFLSPSSCKGWH